MSTEPYVPSVGTVHVAYRNRRPGSAYFLGVTNQDPDAEFDRFIAKVKADAWTEGYETGCSSPYGTATPSGKPYDPEPNPYRIEGKA